MRRLLIFAGSLMAACALPGCAAPSQNPGRPNAYAVFFSATRTADHAPIIAVSVPVNLDGEGRVKTASKTPAETHPALPEFLVRLKRTRQPGVYELVTQVSARELQRNKKGKLKKSSRFLGALVPTRLGETQIVSAEGDPIHVEARLERR